MANSSAHSYSKSDSFTDVSLFSFVRASCDCISSPNFPENHTGDDRCPIDVLFESTLDVKGLKNEVCWDRSGTTKVTVGPDRVQVMPKSAPTPLPFPESRGFLWSRAGISGVMIIVCV